MEFKVVGLYIVAAARKNENWKYYMKKKRKIGLIILGIVVVAIAAFLIVKAKKSANK